MSDRDDIERELLSMAHERDKWKALAGELAAAGNNISDAVEIPNLLGESSKEVMRKAIDRFHAALAKAREAGL